MENIFIILLGLSMIYISSTSRLAAHIKMLTIQGILLFLICISEFMSSHKYNPDFHYIFAILILIVETLIVKSIVIPLFLKRVLNKTSAYRDSDANIPHFYSLVISSVILFAGFLSANIHSSDFNIITPLYFGVSISVIITSLWLITIKHTVLSNVISFITMENGIFLLSLSVAKEMPVIVNLGVLLDIFIAVFILGMLVKEINSRFDDMEISQLTELKDYE